jgi:hypothetical protein
MVSSLQIFRINVICLSRLQYACCFPLTSHPVCTNYEVSNFLHPIVTSSINILLSTLFSNILNLQGDSNFPCTCKNKCWEWELVQKFQYRPRCDELSRYLCGCICEVIQIETDKVNDNISHYGFVIIKNTSREALCANIEGIKTVQVK